MQWIEATINISPRKQRHFSGRIEFVCHGGSMWSGWTVHVTTGTADLLRAPGAPIRFRMPGRLSRPVWCSISAFNSAQSKIKIAEIQSQVMNPIAAPPFDATARELVTRDVDRAGQQET